MRARTWITPQSGYICDVVDQIGEPEDVNLDPHRAGAILGLVIASSALVAKAGARAAFAGASAWASLDSTDRGSAHARFLGDIAATG